jgi:hypothetical protein
VKELYATGRVTRFTEKNILCTGHYAGIVFAENSAKM